MTKRDEDTKPDSVPWDLPHIEAEEFIGSVVQLASRFINEGSDEIEHDDENEDPRDYRDPDEDEDDDEYGDINMTNYLLRGPNPGPILAYPPELDYDGEEIDDLAERRASLVEARCALEAGDPENIVTSLSGLLDLLPASHYFDVLPEVENWANLLTTDANLNPAEGDRISDVAKQVIQAVSDLCEKLCALIAADPNALRTIEWRELERVIATALGGIGFDVTLTPPSKDGGKDVIATCLARGVKQTYYIEVKHWRSGKHVGAKSVFDFVEVNVIDHTQGGLFLSSSGFTIPIHSQLAELERLHIRLGAERKIVSVCQHFVRASRGLWSYRSALPTVLFEETLTP